MLLFWVCTTWGIYIRLIIKIHNKLESHDFPISIKIICDYRKDSLKQKGLFYFILKNILAVSYVGS